MLGMMMVVAVVMVVLVIMMVMVIAKSSRNKCVCNVRLELLFKYIQKLSVVRV